MESDESKQDGFQAMVGDVDTRDDSLRDIEISDGFEAT